MIAHLMDALLVGSWQNGNYTGVYYRLLDDNPIYYELMKSDKCKTRQEK